MQRRSVPTIPSCPHEKALLRNSEIPDKKITIPDPYTQEEFDAMMAVATDEERLLLHMFATTGMREQEIANARRENIYFELGVLYVVKDGDFRGKNKSARREVKLPDDLLTEVKMRGPGYLFPSRKGVRAGHYLRIIEGLARKEGVQAMTEKAYMVAAGMVKDDWCHRFRDNFITNSLHFIAPTFDAVMGLCDRIGHADTETLKKYRGKLKTPYVPVLALRRVEETIKAMEAANAA